MMKNQPFDYAQGKNSKIKNQRYNLGFSLVELLVVIGVLTMVMAVLFPNFMNARQRSRDAQRKNDMNQIQKGLELYKLDQNPPIYPSSLPVCGGSWTQAGISPTCAASQNIYMRKVPCDPGSLAATPYIFTRDSGDTLLYSLSACLENPVDTDRDPTPILPSCQSTLSSYTIHEP